MLLQQLQVALAVAGAVCFCCMGFLLLFTFFSICVCECVHVCLTVAVCMYIYIYVCVSTCVCTYLPSVRSKIFNFYSKLLPLTRSTCSGMKGSSALNAKRATYNVQPATAQCTTLTTIAMCNMAPLCATISSACQLLPPLLTRFAPFFSWPKVHARSTRMAVARYGHTRRRGQSAGYVPGAVLQY